ncbi:short-chain dehydrogenase/reductase SDR [Wolfiporia cocos MD-104 SS10]|uniref:Short-chain dehydrogenase/reductase SDR n=1 Tax=Wolfiporia cocos (strain MD-104) TaxID=742152 RepID=A0A2H3IY06_WOLCO|nr:short-chain dehydrogenase/reductase SDR [Wolfiporia cocos MD-104 SS10]
MSSIRPIIVIAGIGNGSGTGAATARVFAKTGYRVALIARNADHLNKVVTELTQAGGEAAAFPIPGYSYGAVTSVVENIRKYQWPSGGKSEIRVGLWNTGAGVWKGFLDVTEQDLQTVIILAFQENEVDALGKRGTLLFTGATASIRGNVTTSAFAAGKFALRALSQSLNKEFGKQNIHAIIDGGILTDLSLSRRSDPQASKEWQENANIRLDPESIGKAYFYLASQDKSSWTWELDLRPAHEKW